MITHYDNHRAAHPSVGDYVLATRTHSGDPSEGWAVGNLHSTFEHNGETRYMVMDKTGEQYRELGFSKCRKVRQEVGEWLCAVLPVMLMQTPPAGALDVWGMLGDVAYDKPRGDHDNG